MMEALFGFYCSIALIASFIGAFYALTVREDIWKWVGIGLTWPLVLCILIVKGTYRGIGSILKM